MAELAEVHARENDPATMANAKIRGQQISARLSIERLKLLAHAAAIAERPAKKIFWLRKLADELAPAVAGIVPCREGCTHCCHTPALISRIEAALIAKETGAVLQTPPATALTSRTNYAYIGTPCPFLRDNACSIYAVRPFVCRTHYSVDADNLLCQLVPGEQIRVPYVNTAPFNLAYVRAVREDEMDFFDIRDFFAGPRHDETPG